MGNIDTSEIEGKVRTFVADTVKFIDGTCKRESPQETVFYIEEDVPSISVYVLQLEQGKYYVGSTHKTIDEQFSDECSEKGSPYTQMYHPMSIVSRMENVDVSEEDKQVKRYMVMHGIDNVRGGSYSQIELDLAVKIALAEEIGLSSNTCLSCGNSGHYTEDCR